MNIQRGEKKHTTTTERKSFGELFSPQRRELSRPVVDTNALLKPGKPYLPPKSFLCGPSSFSAKKGSSLEQGSVCFLFRKILVSVTFVSVILGPEMGAPILWTPGKLRSFCRKNHVRKIPLFWGVFWGGGGSADFIIMGAQIFLIFFPDIHP